MGHWISTSEAMQTMKYQIWHLLVAMALVALSLPLAKWLLELEAMDHPQKAQTTADFVGFYLGTLSIVGIPTACLSIFIKKRMDRRASSNQDR